MERINKKKLIIAIILMIVVVTELIIIGLSKASNTKEIILKISDVDEKVADISYQIEANDGILFKAKVEFVKNVMIW